MLIKIVELIKLQVFENNILEKNLKISATYWWLEWPVLRHA